MWAERMHDKDIGTRNEQQHRSISIFGYLAILALIPLAGSLWFSATQVSQSTVVSQNAANIAASADQLVHLTTLRTAILDERTWLSAEWGGQELGMTSATINELSGLDFTQRLAESRASVDEAVEALGLRAVAEELMEIRELGLADGGEAAGFRMAELDSKIERLSASEFDRLISLAAATPGGDELATTLRVLARTSEARRSAALQVPSLLSLRFAPTSDNLQSQLQTLILAREFHDNAINDVRRLAANDSHVATALYHLGQSRAAADFAEATEYEVNRYLERGVGSSSPSLLAALEDLDGTAKLLVTGSENADLNGDLVSAASTDVQHASERTQLAALDVRNSALRSAGLVVVCALVFTLAVSRAVVQPLRQLALGAKLIRDGETGQRIPLQGPSEIRQVAATINEATSNLALAEQQALALAQGRYDDESLRQQGPGALGSSLQQAVDTLANSISESDQYRSQLAHKASHDPLTGLVNRSAALAHLDRSISLAERHNTEFAVLFIDLDGFKAINDQHGHHAGDAVLVETAKRLKASLRAGDIVGRLGGDEFLVVTETIADRSMTAQLGERLLTAVSQPIQLDHTQVRVSASVGVAIAPAQHRSAEDLLADADSALYRAKDEGKNRLVFCDSELRDAIAYETRLAREIREALAENHFVLYYQPIVSTDSEQPMVYEALIRWEHPELGLRAPASFIQFAERSELVVEIDQWAVQAAVQQLAQWSHDSQLEATAVAVNVSARSLLSPTFLTVVNEALEKANVAPDRLVIETTEGALLADPDTAALVLNGLHEQGVRVALDDFGTGYTSLTYLRTLPIDILKVDRSLVSDAANEHLLKLMIDTGHFLGAWLVAEGIETDEQYQLLTGVGIDAFQGYLFGRPAPATDITTDTTRHGLRDLTSKPTAMATAEVSTHPQLRRTATGD